MLHTRRQFLSSAAAGSALLAIYGAPAFAVVESEEGRVAGRVLAAAALAPSSDRADRDWTALAEQRLGGGAGAQRAAFAALRARLPTFGQLSPEAAARALASLLIPTYAGQRSIDGTQWMRETDLTGQVIAARPAVDVPSTSGTFDDISAAPPPLREKLIVRTPPEALRGSTVAWQALQAATILVAPTGEAAKMSLTVQL